MTKWNETKDAAAFIASADSRHTSIQIMRAIAFFARNAAEAEAIWEGDWGDIASLSDIWERATEKGQLDDSELFWGDMSLDDICYNNGEISYSFGIYEEYSDGKLWEPIAAQLYDCDAQAELNARHLCEDVGFDGIFIRRGEVEWYIPTN
jgi:hypothetical protein